MEDAPNVSVAIQVENETLRVWVTQAALDQVCAQFNPSGSTAVDRIKLLAAALLSEVKLTGPSRETSLAETNIEQGAMWAVKAATR